jgi:hypothetical protein
MFYWRWGKVRNKKGKEVARRLHGCPLAKRWNGEGLPPLHCDRPNTGAPDLERNHGFHGKIMPGILLGPRCNHDVRNLLHFPVLPNSVQEFLVRKWKGAVEEDLDDAADAQLDTALEEGLDEMVEQLVTRMYYAAGYAGKDQPHAANLLHTLHDSVVRFDAFAATRRAQGMSTDAVDRARRLLQSLIGATNRRMHLGFPSIYAYLLKKPNHHCSHEFVSWSVMELVTTFTNEVLRFYSSSEQRKEPLPRPLQDRFFEPPAHATHKEYDYSYRPVVMNNFPFYFFLAGTKVVLTLRSKTWDWFHATAKNGGLHRRYLGDDNQIMRRGDHPCYRNGLDARLYVSSRVVKNGDNAVPLRDTAGELIVRADHYREIRLHEPWLVLRPPFQYIAFAVLSPGGLIPKGVSRGALRTYSKRFLGEQACCHITWRAYP